MHRAEKVRGPFKRRTTLRHFRYAKAILANRE